MCLIVFCNKSDSLVLAANRDEFYNRPADQAGWWQEYPNLLAGKDLVGKGTWLGITKNGRFAAITNYREFPQTKTHSTSRGTLVKGFLTGSQTVEEYLAFLQNTSHKYDGYNLIFGTIPKLYYFSNKGEVYGEIDEGIHGLSNHLLDTQWPKVEKTKKKLGQLLDTDSVRIEKLFQIMEDTEKAPSDELPDTGIGLEWEKDLSPAFIKTEGYGTRCTTVINVKGKQVVFSEKTHPSGTINIFEFEIN